MPYMIMCTKTFDDFMEKGHSSCMKGKFLVFKNKKHIAIDNEQGEFFMEEFETMEKAVEWLNGEEL